MIICISICHAYHTLSMINYHTVNRAIMQGPRMKMKMKYCIINDYLFCKNGSGVFSKVEIVQFFAVLQPITIHHLSFLDIAFLLVIFSGTSGDWKCCFGQMVRKQKPTIFSIDCSSQLFGGALLSHQQNCSLILFLVSLQHIFKIIYFFFCLQNTAFPFIFKQ